MTIIKASEDLCIAFDSEEDPYALRVEAFSIAEGRCYFLVFGYREDEPCSWISEAADDLLGLYHGTIAAIPTVVIKGLNG